MRTPRYLRFQAQRMLHAVQRMARSPTAPQGSAGAAESSAGPGGAARSRHPASWSDRYYVLQDEFVASLQQMFGHKHESSALIAHAVAGSIKLLDALALAQIMKDARPARILEVGSFLGFSTRWLLEMSAGWSGQVTSVDPRVRHRIFDDVKGHVLSLCSPHSARLTCIDGYFSDRNDAMFLHDYLHYAPKLSPEDARELLARVPLIDRPFAQFDLAFIDGDHGFGATVLNVHLAATMMPEGGLIVVHDAVSWPEVAPALAALCAQSSGLTYEGIAGLEFLRRQASMRSLADGLGLVRVSDARAAAAFDPRPLAAAPPPNR